jgi:ABC-type uncharacterized transport system permease subunit
MTPLVHDLAAVFYLGAAAAGFARARRSVAWLLACGLALHAAAVLRFHGVVPPVPLESVPAALSLVGWLTVAAYLLSAGMTRIQPVGAWVGAVGFALTALASIGLHLREPAAAAPDTAGAWPHAHVLLSTAGFSLLALASLVGLIYLLKERSLKSKRPVPVELPSLESLDRAGQITLSLGFPLLTLGVVSGIFWGLAQEQGLWTRHAAFLVVAWAVYLAPVVLRVFRHRHGGEPARFVVVGFLLLAVSWLGVRMLGSSA